MHVYYYHLVLMNIMSPPMKDFLLYISGSKVTTIQLMLKNSKTRESSFRKDKVWPVMARRCISPSSAVIGDKEPLSRVLSAILKPA